MAPSGAWTNDSGRLTTDCKLMNLCGSHDEKCIFHNKLKGESGFGVAAAGISDFSINIYIIQWLSDVCKSLTIFLTY